MAALLSTLSFSLVVDASKRNDAALEDRIGELLNFKVISEKEI